MRNILRKIKANNWHKKFLIFCLFLAISFVFVNSVFAQTDGNTPAQTPAADTPVNNTPVTPTAATPDETSNWVSRFFSWIFGGIIGFEGTVLVLLTRVFLAIVKYNGFVNSPAVVTGWTLVRDVANMFFILIMLAIALGTILHIESYNFKRLLPKVLIMAVLVNFSRTICGLAIDFAQVVMMTFAVGFASIAGAGDLMATLHITEMLYASSRTFQDHSITNFTSTFITGLLAVILLLVAVITVLVMLVVVIMRMVMLWLLVVLSPLPFVLSAFPAGQKYAQQWTQEFTKYVIVGPILAFFLWLSLAVSSTGKLENMVNDPTVNSELATLNKEEPNVAGADQQTTNTVFTAIGNPNNFLAFLIGIGMLMGGLMITQQLGVSGGAFAGQMSNRIRQTGLTGLKMAAKSPLGAYAWGARKVAAGYLPGGVGAGLQLNPMIIYQGIKKSFQERKDKEILQGQVASGKAMEAGGPMGLLKGLGSGQDFADAYIKGLFGIRGLIAAGRSVIGGPDKVEEIRRQEESEKKQAKLDFQQFENRRMALGLTDEDRKNTIEKMKYDPTDADFSDAFKEAKEGREAGKDPNFLNRTLPDGTKQSYYQALRDAKIKPADPTKPEDKKRYEDERAQFNKRWDESKAHEILEGKGLSGGRMPEEYANDLLARANKGDIKALRELTDKTDDFYDNTAKKKEEEANRIAAGGFSDDELKNNQKKLLTVNERIAALLKRIQEDKKLGRETSGLEAQMNALITDNKSIGNLDAKSGLLIANDKIDKVGEEGSVERREFEKRRQAMAEESRNEAEKNRLLSQASRWNQDDRTRIQAEAKKFSDTSTAHGAMADKYAQRAEKYVPPRAFYASIAERELVGKEQKKITSELDTELIANFKDALRDNDVAKASALMKKLAADGNDNELWNAFGFSSDHKGMHNFFDAVMMGKKVIKPDGTVYSGPALKMNEQQALALESDVSFINEKVNHWETARLIEVKDGKYERMSEADHTAAALAEIMKKNPREISRAYNRLAYGGETPNPDGGRNFNMSTLGVAILRSLGKEISENIKKTGAEYSKNAVMNIGGLSDDELMRIGVGKDYIQEMRVKYNKLVEEAGTSVGSIVSRIFDEGIAEAIDARNRSKIK